MEPLLTKKTSARSRLVGKPTGQSLAGLFHLLWHWLMALAGDQLIDRPIAQ